MRNPTKLWTLYNSSKQLNTRPSEVAGISDRLAAYCFDRAVLYFGNTVENEIKDGTKNAKNDGAARAKANRILAKWLSTEGETPRGVYRDPMTSGAAISTNG